MISDLLAAEQERVHERVYYTGMARLAELDRLIEKQGGWKGAPKLEPGQHDGRARNGVSVERMRAVRRLRVPFVPTVLAQPCVCGANAWHKRGYTTHGRKPRLGCLACHKTRVFPL